ncbi:MAG: Stp1/IreP family PP2C-type Ser/Thr phosphatase [Syntrophales bacterium]|jgi:protein phosphatase|nr:Stp1/IreP family PP2C-type Ser/Thr phosphatase [Syntrophales bacterium]
MELLVGAKTDVGRTRKNNEDNFLVMEKPRLLLVADGMGGHASGEIASRMAVDTIRNFFDSGAKKSLQIGAYDEDYSEATNRLGSAIRFANMAIHEAAAGNAAWQGMGTTVVAGLLTDHRLSIAHVGDSRLYLIRAGGIEQLTDDHSVVAEQVKRELISRDEAQKSEMKSILTRALGTEAEVDVDLCEMATSDEDVLILCSDGLSNMVTDEDMLSIVSSSKDPDAAAAALVDLANSNGGKDNITVVTAYLLKEGWLSSLLRFFGWGRR